METLAFVRLLQSDLSNILPIAAENSSSFMQRVLSTLLTNPPLHLLPRQRQAPALSVRVCVCDNALLQLKTSGIYHEMAGPAALCINH